MRAPVDARLPDSGGYQICGLYDVVQSKVAQTANVIRQAEDFDDFGLKVVLENQVADETRHKEELERIIAGWDER